MSSGMNFFMICCMKRCVNGMTKRGKNSNNAKYLEIRKIKDKKLLSYSDVHRARQKLGAVIFLLLMTFISEQHTWRLK